MFVTAQDFKAPPYELVRLDSHKTFLTYADREEKDMLRKVLGGLLYNAFIAGVAALPAEWVSTTNYALDALVVYGSDIYKSLMAGNQNQIPSSSANWEKQPDNRWLKLKKGNSYKYEEKTYEWVGFHVAFVPYIHSMWIVETVDSVSSNGTAQSANENSTVVNPYRRVCKSHNQFADYIGTEKCLRDTLYGYLFNSGDMFIDVVGAEYVSIATYLELTFKSPGRKNAFQL